MSNCLLNGYRFCAVSAPDALAARIEAAAQRAQLTGSVLIATEGVNVALFGARFQLEHVLADIVAAIDGELVDVLWTPMPSHARPFRRLRVRVRPEIVTFEHSLRTDAPSAEALPAPAWNALLDDPQVRVLDVRNIYEYEHGHFVGAENPHTESFTEFRDYVLRELLPEPERPIAMYCTGGIRCAKAGAWMRELGFEQVYQLKGGILGYLADAAADDAHWQGECFVFDDRPQMPGLPKPSDAGGNA